MAQRIRVQKDGTVPTTCPGCGKVNALRAQQFPETTETMEFQCSCGRRYTVLAEFRKAFRRETNLPGSYEHLSVPGQSGEIQIEDMSMMGLGFRLKDNHEINKGDALLLHFELKDENNTDMTVVATVARVYDRFVGCAFKELSSQQEEALVSFFMTF